MFLLNGIEYLGAAQVGTTPGGASGQLLGIDAVREFNVQTDTYGAEYGKRAGGQISIVTTSGGNAFHGTLFEFLRNSVLDARNFFDRTKPQFKRNNFGAAAGGPIRKDKTFLFGNYEGFRQSLTTTNVAFVPDANARRGFLPTGPGGALVNVGLAPGIAPYFALWPEPNGPELGGGIAQSFAPALNPVQEDFGTVRLDNNFSERDSFSAVYTIDDGTVASPKPNPFSGTTIIPRAQSLSLEETHTFSPNFLNTARVGFSRAAWFQDNAPLISLPTSLSMVEGKPMGQVTVGGGASVSLSALSVFGDVSVNRRAVRNLFTYTDSVQIVKGLHLISAGASLQRVQSNPTYGDSYGSVAFPSLSDFLQGRASNFAASATPAVVFGNRQLQGAWFVQDTIKVLPNLTLNIGLRHEFTDGWNEVAGRNTNYVIGADGVLQSQPVIGSSVLTENNAKWLFSPRIGLAWDPFGNGKTSIRAGFGTYYNLLDDLDFWVIRNPPLVQQYQISNIQFPIQVKEGVGIPSGAVIRASGLPPDLKTPTVQEWSLRVEQELTASTVLSVGYVGSHGYRFLGAADVNPAQSVICSTSLGNCPGDIPEGTRFFPAGSPRLNPQLGSTSSYTMPHAYNNFNSLQMDLRQRLSKGITFRANYSYSKAMDNSSITVSAYASNCPAYIMDLRDPRRDYSPACHDVTHRFAFNGSYDLPIGRGQALLSGLSGAAKKLLGGWKLNGIVTLQSGLPLTPAVGFSRSRDGNVSPVDRPSWNPSFSGPVILGTPNRWYDPSAFLLPPAGTYGNAGRNVLRAPGLETVDLSLFKETLITERVNLQFRAEFFNLLNRANFGIPSPVVFTPTGQPAGSAGVISNTITTSRQIQLGLKLIW